MEIQYRKSRHMGHVILVADGLVIGAWVESRDTMRNFQISGKLSEWMPNYPYAINPNQYGALIMRKLGD